VAILISLLTLPIFNKLLNTSLSLTYTFSITTIILVLVVITGLGLVAGLIPAYMITRFKTVDIVKGAFARKSKGLYGKSLIAFQYAVTIILLIATFIIVKQAYFMKNYDLGFDKDNVIILENKIRNDRHSALRSEFEKLPGVINVSFVIGNPVDGGNNNSFKYNEKALSFQEFIVDSVFFEMMNLKVTPTGVALSPDAVWLNKTAVRELELEDLPQEVIIGNNTTPILGVVEDFHFRDLNEELGPVFIKPLYENNSIWSILVKIRKDNLKENFDDVKRVYSEFISGNPFEAEFMDQTINSWYEKNERNAQLVGYFAILTIVLAVMGLLAMASYFMQQRVKEIGVRRVNGAMVGEVFSMLVMDFVKWILVAFVVACPIAWYVMKKWLSDFPYRTEINWWIYVLAGMFALIVAVIIISWQSVRVATTNPVNTLKSE
ncbi:MAG: hypothetical protein LIO65_01185, partial [Odoribacter sp.]|nr:hypothetical protein [Odoribacter sp.]